MKCETTANSNETELYTILMSECAIGICLSVDRIERLHTEVSELVIFPYAVWMLDVVVDFVGV